MSKIERIGISIEKELLEGFDSLISNKGYQNRSEAVRDLIREKLSQKELENPDAEVFACVSVAYDHHNSQANKRLIEIQHNDFFNVIASMHIHIDHHNCLEIITLKGKAGEIRKMADSLTSLKGVKLGKVSIISTATENISHHHPHKH